MSISRPDRSGRQFTINLSVPLTERVEAHQAELEATVACPISFVDVIRKLIREGLDAAEARSGRTTTERGEA